MVQIAAPAGADVSNRGIQRGRLFFGTLILIAAFIAWATALWISPHGAEGPAGDQLRPGVVVFLRNSAIGTLALSALAAYLLFPERRPDKPVRDWVIRGILAVMVLASLWQLAWLQFAVLR